MRKTALALMLILSLSLLPSYAEAQVEYIVEILRWDARFAIPQVSPLPGIAFNVYELPPSEQYERGGIEWEIILYQRPLATSFAFAFQSSNLVFYYQPPLDEELNVADYDFVNETHAIKDGLVLVHRPLNVVGSYAVYHSSKRNNEYKTGKAFHLYRIHLVDAVGREAWGEYNEDVQTAGYLRITLPQAFLDSAVYPVTVDPTFGYTSKGGSNTVIYENIAGCLYPLSEDGTVTKLSVYIERSSTGGPYNVGSLIYDNVGDKNLENRVNSTITYPYDDWFNFTWDYGSTAASWWLCFWMGNAAGARLYYDSGDTDQYGVVYKAWNTAPDPITWSSTQDWQLSIYATYTLAGGQEKTFELEETVAVTATLDQTKALLFTNTDSMVPSELLSFGKEKGIILSQTIAVNEAINQVKELIVTFTETVTITVSLDFTSEIYGGIERVFEFIETVMVNSILDHSVEIQLTFFEFLETVHIQGNMYPTLPEIPAEAVEYGLIALAVATVALALAITAGKTE